MTGSMKEAALGLLLDQKGAVVEDIKFFKGDADSFTVEELWGQVHSALMQERMGTATISNEFVDGAVLVDAQAFLASL